MGWLQTLPLDRTTTPAPGMSGISDQIAVALFCASMATS